MIVDKNPLGGRPMQVGQITWEGTPIKKLKPLTILHYHLGYCEKCGTKIVADNEAINLIYEGLKKAHRDPAAKGSFRLRLVHWLMPKEAI